MAESFGILMVMFLLAFLVESFVEYLMGTPINNLGKRWPWLLDWKWALMYASVVVGVAISFWYQTDVIYVLGQSVGAAVTQSWVGYLLTGIGISRGANWMHQLVSTYFPRKG